MSLFFTYIVEFDHLIEEHRQRETGNLLIYLHYFILFGLSLITVSLHFISDQEANPNFAATCLFSGLTLFYFGLLLANHYNNPQRFVNAKVITGFVVTTGIGYIATLLLFSFNNAALILTLVTLINAAILTRFMINRNNIKRN